MTKVSSPARPGKIKLSARLGAALQGWIDTPREQRERVVDALRKGAYHEPTAPACAACRMLAVLDTLDALIAATRDA